MHSYPEARRQAQQLAAGGDLPGARAVLEQVVDLGRPGLAAGDPELLATMRQLAGLHARGGDPAGARRLLEEASAAGQRIGPGDPLIVLLAYDLAVVAEELGNRHEARKNFALVAEHGPAALGEGHAAVAHARDHAADSPAPVPAPPISGPPASGPPASGLPVSGPPVLGEAAGGGVSGSRTPWVIAAAAVVFAVAMLVVVLVRPGAEPDSGAPLAGAAASAPAVPPAASAPATTEPAPARSTAPATSSPAPKAPAASKRTQAVPTTTAPPTAKAVGSRIVTPKNGSGVVRQFTVTFAVSAADVAATGTRLALTVCVDVWCFLDGPVVIENGKAKDYTVTLGTGEGEGVGEKWTLRIDRLAQSTYDDLQDQKQAAIDNGTWGNGVTTAKDRLNKTPVSAVVVTKTS